MFYAVLTNPGLIIWLQVPHQSFAKSWCCGEQVREACGVFAGRVRWEEGSGWQLCARDTPELGQAVGKLSRTAAPESSLQKHSHGNVGSAIKAN